MPSCHWGGQLGGRHPSGIRPTCCILLVRRVRCPSHLEPLRTPTNERRTTPAVRRLTVPGYALVNGLTSLDRARPILSKYQSVLHFLKRRALIGSCFPLHQLSVARASAAFLLTFLLSRCPAFACSSVFPAACTLLWYRPNSLQAVACRLVYRRASNPSKPGRG